MHEVQETASLQDPERKRAARVTCSVLMLGSKKSLENRATVL